MFVLFVLRFDMLRKFNCYFILWGVGKSSRLGSVAKMVGMG
jgi:hypothetical protein